jgi:GUN4-like
MQDSQRGGFDFKKHEEAEARFKNPSPSYQALEEHLANGRWEEADKETYRLMITTVGKEEGQWFEPEELRNFPCEDLLTIDRLWVKYSNDKFGFSVQKKIYHDCGRGRLFDGKYIEKKWECFCSDNGWTKGGNYVKVMYDISSPKGHLPYGVIWIVLSETVIGTAYVDVSLVSSFLFFRIETCKV